jgi:hypothetical protein
MRKEITISLMPLASNADTPYQPIIDAWKQAGCIIKDHEFGLSESSKVQVSLDASELIDVLESCLIHDEERLRLHMVRWAETNEFVRLKIAIEGPEAVVADRNHLARVVQALVEEMFLALNLSAAGAGHFNGGVCKELSDNDLLSYYGDSIESAWFEAKEWGWPSLANIPFERTWGWLQKIGFRECWLAKDASHKALIALLDGGKNKSEVEEVLLVARSIEALIGGEGISIGHALKSRISKILGTPDSHKGWLADFYSLRSRVAHGNFPLIRPSLANEDESADYASKLWQPLDRSRAVVLGLLQNLVLNGSSAFGFEERIVYVRLKPL